MRATAARSLKAWLAALAAVSLGGALFGLASDAFRDFHHWSGWTLLAMTGALALYGARRRIGLVSASGLLLLHLHLGWVAALLFAFHAGGIPQPGFAMLLWVSYALTLATGAVGYALCRVVPSRQWEERLVPYGRLRQERNDTVGRALRIMESLARGTRDADLALFFARHLVPYLFGRPPMWRLWVGSHHARDRILALLDDATGHADRDGVAELVRLIQEKHGLDVRRARFWLVRGWLMVHILFTCLALASVVAHVVLVHALGA